VSRSVILIMIFLGSCAGGMGPQLPAAEEFLIPQIQADGTKFFLFQRDYQSPSGDPSDRLLGREVPGQRDLRSPDMNDAINRRLDEVMLATGYCRDGFFELHRDNTRQGLTLRGECREDATATDRSRFDGSSIPLAPAR
jgi:hypothetical protein